MTSKAIEYPALISVPRFTTLFASLLVTLSSGTNYVDPDSSTAISTFTFGILILCSFMTGAGGNAGLTSGVNSTAKTFPDQARATATGVVLSGFGLSAFLFSTISRVKFAGNTSSFILLLSLGTSLPMIIGFFLVRPIPLPPTDPIAGVERGAEETDEARDEHRALLAAQESVDAPAQLSRRAALNQGILPNVYGRKLFTSSDFWLLFTILSLLSGTGLMYINNVGSMSQALYAKSTRVYNPVDAARWQANQVASISLLNFAGRIFIGIVADYGKNRWSLPRSYSLVLASIFFFVSQVMAAHTEQIKHLWMASTMLGLAHGSVFSIFPTVCLEWFGMPHFSENWGFMSASPIIAGNLFSFVFGRTLDAHEKHLTQDALAGLTPSQASLAAQCTLGLECYAGALYLTTGACFLSIFLSAWAGWRDRKKLETGRTMASRRSAAAAAWEGARDEDE
ncbi:hypothetical protein H0H81_002728 [Sphagnurus paluster]|uniref:MFS general substrate transporter n=1 Tax=Sphagnurus paluster TaxID=117069 RepID=A0A9P7FZ50_9AGAR|nr:hypothetical protein H0H81_002728 [Sphagnurus paluster]